MVLEGSFEFHIGNEAQETTVLNKWDVFSCPPEVYRGFTNVSDKDSVLLTFVTGDVNARDDVSVPPKITNAIRDEFGEDVLNSFKAVATFQE
jgi:quercetin dioxygenase-like cupin family protein